MVDAALAGLAVLVTAAMVALALVRFFAALHPDPGAAFGSEAPGGQSAHNALMPNQKTTTQAPATHRTSY